MAKPLRALIVEDCEPDAELLLAALGAAGYAVTYERVETADTMRAALEHKQWDVVLSDYSLPQFSGPAALETLRATGQDLPFIIISGTIGEETAVSALKSGAHDFLVKGRLARLIPALERELRDVAARRDRLRLEDQLRQSQKMEAIGQLAGGIAHDFNNLLTAILGYSELLREQLHNAPDALADLEEIAKAGERAASLTRQLLAFSRKQHLEPQVLDLRQIIADIEKMLRRIIGEDIRFHIGPCDAVTRVKADRSQMEQVLVNLVVNARDAMPRGGTLTVQAGHDDPPSRLLPADAAPAPDGWVSLVVKDTGCGMPPEIQARIFEPFFTTKGAGKGTGLGLSTVYGIVRQSGGHINVESHSDVGTSFTIYLPAVRDAIESIAVAQVSNGGVGTETILLVEDDDGIRALVRKLLASRGYTVLEASGGNQAMVVSQQYSGIVHLLLTDIVMPDLSGPDMAQRILGQRPKIAVLYMSGFSGRLSAHLDTSGSGAGFLHKPFTPETLLKKVRASLERSAQPANP
jgi:signal transduction histidine kinase